MAIKLTFSLNAPINLLTAPEMKDEYHDAMIQEMKKARSLGMKICVFMCKTENEELPKEAGKLWLSWDKELTGTIPAGRIHLWGNLTDEKHLKKFNGLIDEIAVDQSSVKGFISSDFIPRFAQLFYPSPDAKLTFENCFFETYSKNVNQPVIDAYSIQWPENQMEMIGQKQHEWFAETYTKGSEQYNQKFSQFSERIKIIAHRQQWDENKYHKQFRSWIIQNEFPQEKDPGYLVQREANEKRKALLEKYFQSVKLIENQLYPYETKLRSEKDCYFVAQGLKIKPAADNESLQG